MKGYDNKRLKLSADKDVEVSLFIHHIHYSEKADIFKTFKLKAGEEKEYHFPEGFSAHWVQLKAGKDCEATAWFTYD